MKSRSRPATPQDDKTIRRMYNTHRCADIAEALGWSSAQKVSDRAAKLGLRRPPGWLRGGPVGEVVRHRDGRFLTRHEGEDGVIRYKSHARSLWETKVGAIPAGHVIALKSGVSQDSISRVSVDMLECVPRSEIMIRNSVHKFPEDLQELITLRGQITKAINKRIDKDE